jgi:hypothetical protein
LSKIVSAIESGEFGTLSHSYIATNQAATQHGGRVFLSYAIPSEIDSCGDNLWVITESDRSSTTVLFPGEY